MNVVETDVAIVDGNLPAVQAQAPKPIPWEVEIWPINGQLFSTSQYTPANYAAALATVAVDNSIQQTRALGPQLYTGQNWLTLGPRGTRLQVYGQSVSIQLSSTNTAPAVIATAPALRFRVRVAPAGPPRHPDNQRIVQLARGDLNGVGNALQFPAFCTEYRVYGGPSPYNGVILLDATYPGNFPNPLIDPFSSIAQIFQVIDVAEWTPLHPLAAGVFLNAGATLETR
jgi:hypothetical protein